MILYIFGVFLTVCQVSLWLKTGASLCNSSLLARILKKLLIFFALNYIYRKSNQEKAED